MRSLLLFGIQLFVFSLFTRGQRIHFINMNTVINPPSEECYNVIRDDEGYLWISTEKGLMKVAGNTVQFFNSKQHASEDAIYAMRRMSNGRCLFISARNQVFWSEDDHLVIDKKQTAFAQSTEIPEKLTPSIIYHIQESGKQKYLFSNQGFTFEYDLTSQTSARVKLPSDGNNDINYLINVEGAFPHYIKNPFLESFDGNKLKRPLQTIILKNGAAQKKIEILFAEKDYSYWRNLFSNSNDLSFFSIHNKLLVIQKDLSYSFLDLPNRILSMYTDSRGGLWIGLATGGGVYFPHPSLNMSLNDAQLLLADLSVSGFCEDREGNIWSTTLERGVFVANSPHVTYFPGTPLSDRRSYFLRRDGDQVYTSSRLDKLFSISNGRLSGVPISFNQEFEISDVAHIGQYFYVATKAFMYQLAMTASGYKPVAMHPNSVYELASDGKKLYAMSRGWISEVGDHYFRKLVAVPMKSQSVILFDSTHLYIGGNKGVYLLNLMDTTLSKLDGGDIPISRIIQCRDRSIYATSFGKGLCLITAQSITPVSDSTIPTDLNDLTEDPNGNLWLASNKGLVFFNRKNGQHYLLNKSNGLMADYVNKVVTDERYIYASTSEGLCLLPLDEPLFNMTAPALRLRTFLVNGQPSDISKGPSLPYSSNDLSWKFDLFSFKRGGSEGFLYRLSPYDTGYTFSRDSIVSYKHLPPGHYTLAVYAVNNNGIRSSKPYNYPFTIALPFWKTNGFILGSVMALTAILFGIVWLIIRRIKRKEEEKTQWNKMLADSKLAALQSQMNPHFIFNSINSIQNYILDRNATEAYAYLSKFSKLIRKVLVNSREKVISLENELETLRLYIELERLRFDEAFDFHISLSPDINTREIMIPTMIIQPYVENAIWHGLMNLKDSRRGNLSLSFSIDDHFLIIIIDDNGVGRKQAASLKQRNIHKPEGLNITSERIELVNRMSLRKDNAVQIFDKRDADGYSLGTRVEITINTKQYGE